MFAGLSPVVPGVGVYGWILELCGGGTAGSVPAEYPREMSGTGNVSKILAHPID